MDSLYSPCLIEPGRDTELDPAGTGGAVPRSLYIHIPFCRRRCFYCDFPISVVGDKSPKGTGERINGSNSQTIAHYIDVLLTELRQTAATGKPLDTPLDTIFFGGGTPSLLAAAQVDRILTEVADLFGIAADAEISMEIDPATFDLAQVQGYRAAGVNRASLGVQAFQPELLQVAGRSHTVADIDSAVEMVKTAGFTNISLDLISGLPHQTLDQWEESLHRAIALAPTHISCYDLIVEAGTPFSRQYKPGVHPLPSDDLAADLYRAAQRILTAHGFHHYEISNYAQPGYDCRHNRVYWENRPFYGVGMGATSSVQGDRVARPRKTWDYYQWVEDLIQQPSGDRPEPTPPDLLDTVMLGLRLAEGLAWSSLRQQFGDAAIARLWRCLQPAIAAGWVNTPTPPDHQPPTSGRLRLTDPEGFLFSNVVLTAVFEEFDPD